MTFVIVGIFIFCAAIMLLGLAIYEVRSVDEVADDPDGVNVRYYHRKVDAADRQRAFLFGLFALIVAGAGGAVICYGIGGP